MGRERGLRKNKLSITSVKLFGMGKVSGITKKNSKSGHCRILRKWPKTTFEWPKVVSEVSFPRFWGVLSIAKCFRFFIPNSSCLFL